MRRGKLIIRALTAAFIVEAVLVSSAAAGGQTAPAAQAPSFKSAVDLVRVGAVVRDRHGRFVPDLQARDFTVLDDGAARPIADFRHDAAGISVALLFDVSGSMEARLPKARAAATQMLGLLDPTDEAAVFTFDTHLDEVEPFTQGLRGLPARLSSVRPFGATSLNDAIAATARRTTSLEGGRRAVVVFTDGNDNSSQLTPGQVSGLASAIDVPVYIVAIVPAIDNPSTSVSTGSRDESALVGTLNDLSEWTGGRVFLATTLLDRTAAVRQIVDELRHQYLIAFEASDKPGWHPLVLRTRDKNLTVRARSGYFAGQSRPVSQ